MTVVSARIDARCPRKTATVKAIVAGILADDSLSAEERSDLLDDALAMVYELGLDRNEVGIPQP